MIDLKPHTRIVRAEDGGSKFKDAEIPAQPARGCPGADLAIGLFRSRGGRRRWTDFEEYLIPRTAWAAEPEQHYAALGLPI